MAKKGDNAAGEGMSVKSAKVSAFDLWLQRGLHQLFDEVAREPVPEDLLRLIEDDRKRSS